jgi:hypothetical protein
MYFDGEGHGHHSLPPAPSEEQEMKKQMYFDQHEDGEGHGHHSLPPAPSEEQEMKNSCIFTSTRRERVTATALFHLHQVKRRR